MSIAAELLKAPHLGIRDIKERLSRRLLKDVLIITDRGIPVSVNLPYADMLEWVDIIDELTDLETINRVREGRKAVHEGAQGIPVVQLFKKIRANRE